MFNSIDPKRFVTCVILMIQQKKIWIVILKILIWRAQKTIRLTGQNLFASGWERERPLNQHICFWIQNREAGIKDYMLLGNKNYCFCIVGKWFKCDYILDDDMY